MCVCEGVGGEREREERKGQRGEETKGGRKQGRKWGGGEKVGRKGEEE